MGFLDKAKEQASALGKKASEGINQGQAKLDDAQAGRKAKALLAELGAWAWAKENGRGGDLADTELERLRAELVAHEAEHGPIEEPTAPEAPEAEAPPAVPPPGAVGGPPPPGDVPPPPGSADGPAPAPAGEVPPPPA